VDQRPEAATGGLDAGAGDGVVDQPGLGGSRFRAVGEFADPETDELDQEGVAAGPIGRRLEGRVGDPVPGGTEGVCTASVTSAGLTERAVGVSRRRNVRTSWVSASFPMGARPGVEGVAESQI
jgi:hypothetical protein